MDSCSCRAAAVFAAVGLLPVIGLLPCIAAHTKLTGILWSGLLFGLCDLANNSNRYAHSYVAHACQCSKHKDVAGCSYGLAP